MRYFFLVGVLFLWLVYFFVGERSEVVGGWLRMGGIEVVFDIYNFLLVLGELIFFFVVVLYFIDYFKKDVKFFVLFFLVYVGFFGVFISRDFFNFYIFMEIVLVLVFVLVGFFGRKDVFKVVYKYFMFLFFVLYFFVFFIGIIYFKMGYLNFELIFKFFFFF